MTAYMASIGGVRDAADIGVDVDRVVRDGLGDAGYAEWLEFREAERRGGLWGPETFWSMWLCVTCDRLGYWW